MKEFKLQANIKLVLFVFALSMALAVLWINSNIITNLREGNKRQIEKDTKYLKDKSGDLNRAIDSIKKAKNRIAISKKLIK